MASHAKSFVLHANKGISLRAQYTCLQSGSNRDTSAMSQSQQMCKCCGSKCSQLCVPLHWWCLHTGEVLQLLDSVLAA